MTEVKGVRKKETELEELAADVLELSRGRLLVNLRYMDVALTFLDREVYYGSFSADGRVLYYDPAFVLRTYRESKEKLTRTYLHLVLHCVFCHPFVGPDVERRLWDLACDMACESVICELDLPCTKSDDDGRRRDMLRKIRRETGFLTAEKIYSALRKGELGSVDTVENLEQLFMSDEHSAWYSDDVQPPAVQTVLSG